jgi:hypothetical protein
VVPPGGVDYPLVQPELHEHLRHRIDPCGQHLFGADQSASDVG